MIKGDESQVYTFIIDDISENNMMLLEPSYEYIPKPNLYTEEKSLPSLLDWGESDLKHSNGSYFIQSDQMVFPVEENTITLHSTDAFKLDSLTKVNSLDFIESQDSLQSTPTSVIVKNVSGSSIEPSHGHEYSEGGIDIAALVDMCFRDED